MTLEEAKDAITRIEGDLSDAPFVIVHTFERDEREIRVALTDRLRKIARKARVWKSKPFLTAFKNATYGYDESHAVSAGGADGIFRLSRDYKPANEMMTKIFDRYLDKDSSGAVDLAKNLETSIEELIPVRLVSHHMRLLGVLNKGAEFDTLALVDFDNTK